MIDGYDFGASSLANEPASGSACSRIHSLASIDAPVISTSPITAQTPVTFSSGMPPIGVAHTRLGVAKV